MVKILPELTVIMATYNENIGFLNTCINSVLHQTFQDFEFIIVIEPEETNAVFLEAVSDKDARVRILQNKSRLGVAASRNSAILNSCGRYIAIIDGDDYCCPNRFEKQINFLEHNADVSVVGSNMLLVDENDKIIGERQYPEMHNRIKNLFLLTMAIANPTVMIRRKDINDVGFFDNSLHKAEDFELWLRFLAKNKKMHNLQENLVYYRVPTSHNERRGQIHWNNNYNARKKHGKFIWPLHQRIMSMLFFFVISHMPENYLNSLIRFNAVNRIKKIKIN